jgi:hypothetical protein
MVILPQFDGLKGARHAPYGQCIGMTSSIRIFIATVNKAGKALPYSHQ